MSREASGAHLVDNGASRQPTPGERLFVHYIRNPSGYWPDRAQRQARKVEQRLRAVSRELKVPPGQLLASLFSRASHRVRGSRRRTVHLANIGSSGSHWLENMLVEGVGMRGAGEVYIPPDLRRKIKKLTADEATVFFDALLLLHAGGVAEDQSASVVHSLHSARPEDFLEADPDTLRVMLLRNPVDVCLSRVFRKDEYRGDVAPDADDMAYLDVNIAKVKEFLSTAREQVFDLVLRYEDLLTDPKPALGAIAALTGAPVDPDRLDEVIEAQSAERLAANGGARATNLYVGSPRTVPEAASLRAHKQLDHLAAHFGYAVAHE